MDGKLQLVVFISAVCLAIAAGNFEAPRNESQTTTSSNNTVPTSRGPTSASNPGTNNKEDDNDAETILPKILNQMQNKSDSRLRPKIGREPITVFTDMFILDLGYISEANMVTVIASVYLNYTKYDKTREVTTSAKLAGTIPCLEQIQTLFRKDSRKITYPVQDKEEFRASFFLRMYWKDERLAYHNTGYKKRLALNAKMVQHMWIPDIYFVNEKSGIKHDLTKENEVVRLWPNGDVFHSMRLSMTASCPMHLHNYPLDKQVCRLLFESFSYEATELLFRWKKDKGNIEVVVSEDLQIPQFILTNYWTEETLANFTSGAYSRLIVWFQFERSIGFFLIQTYIPAYLIVMLSWIAFWINHNSTPARVALGITTVLTLTTLTNSARASLPKVSYVKSIEWFLIVCFLYVFASLVEFAFVSLEISRKLKRGMEIPAVQAESDDGKDSEKKELVRVMDGNVEANGHTKIRRRAKFSFYNKRPTDREVLQYRPYSEKEIEALESAVDFWCRIWFPVSFIVLNMIYWVLTVHFS